jgi:hypothetical protein
VIFVKNIIFWDMAVNMRVWSVNVRQDCKDIEAETDDRNGEQSEIGEAE